MNKFKAIPVSHGENVYHGNIKIYSRKLDMYFDIKDLYITSNKKVYKKESTGMYKELSVYINKFGKYAYYCFHYNRTNIKLHNALAQIAVPGYKANRVCIFLDDDSLNLDINNLRWVDVSYHRSNIWNKLSQEERDQRAKKYGEKIKEAHAKGSYTEHYKVMHAARSDSKAQNRQNFELLRKEGISIPSEKEMAKMAEYFKEV